MITNFIVNLSPYHDYKLNCGKVAFVEGLVDLETKGKWKILDAAEKDVKRTFYGYLRLI